jgi:hypothetical protein
LIVILRIPDMLATLASLFVIQGVAMTYSYGGSITENMVLPSGDGGRGDSGGVRRAGQVPTIVIIMLVVTVVAQLALSFTTHGRRMYAIGGNPEAARSPACASPLQSGGLRDCLAAGRAGRHFAGLAHRFLAGECRRRLPDGCGGGGVDWLFAGGFR